MSIRDEMIFIKAVQMRADKLCRNMINIGKQGYYHEGSFAFLRLPRLFSNLFLHFMPLLPRRFLHGRLHPQRLDCIGFTMTQPNTPLIGQ